MEMKVITPVWLLGLVFLLLAEVFDLEYCSMLISTLQWDDLW